MNELYTPEEVAARLKVGKTLVYQLLRSGKLPHSRVGNRYRVSGEDIRAYLDSTRLIDHRLCCQCEKDCPRCASLRTGLVFGRWHH